MTDYFYVTSRSGSSNEILREWNGASLVAVASNEAPRYITGPWGDRYVQGHYTSSTATPSGANGTTSTVWFSRPAGTFSGVMAWGDDDWVQVDPEDGEEITGMAVWRELLFVVKQSRLYVFYTVGVDGLGGAQFVYREVNLPSRMRATTTRGGENIVAGGDGVYLYCGDGIYRTTGDIPQLVSKPITPLFDGSGSSTMVLPSTGDWNFGYSSNRVYLSYTVNSTYRTLVYDIVLGEWLLWDVSVGSSAVPSNVIEWVNTNGLPTGYVASGSKVWSFTDTATSDDGTAVTWSYQSGFYEVGPPDHTAFTRWTRLWGSGAPTVSVLTDHGTSDSNAAAVTLGTAPAVDDGYHLKAYAGRLFSHKFSGTSAAVIHRLMHHVTGARP